MVLLKRNLRDLLIWGFCTSGVVSWYKSRQPSSLVRVVCLHDVTDAVWLEELILSLQQRYQILTPDQFRAGDFVIDKINVLLTFDDGYHSWVSVVLPVLEKYKVTALFFVSSGLLEVATQPDKQATFVRERLELQTKRRTLSWAEAETLISSGQVIGGHTYGHHHVSQLSAEQCRQEVGKDKELIERKLNTTVTDFAYPFGTPADHTEATKQLVFGMGYTLQYTAEPGWYTLGAQSVPRTLLDPNQTLTSMHRWLEGAYDIVWRLCR